MFEFLQGCGQQARLRRALLEIEVEEPAQLIAVKGVENIKAGLATKAATAGVGQAETKEAESNKQGNVASGFQTASIQNAHIMELKKLDAALFDLNKAVLSDMSDSEVSPSDAAASGVTGAASLPASTIKEVEPTDPVQYIDSLRAKVIQYELEKELTDEVVGVLTALQSESGSESTEALNQIAQKIVPKLRIEAALREAQSGQDASLPAKQEVMQGTLTQRALRPTALLKGDLAPQVIRERNSNSRPTSSGLPTGLSIDRLTFPHVEVVDHAASGSFDIQGYILLLVLLLVGSVAGLLFAMRFLGERGSVRKARSSATSMDDDKDTHAGATPPQHPDETPPTSRAKGGGRAARATPSATPMGPAQGRKAARVSNLTHTPRRPAV